MKYNTKRTAAGQVMPLLMGCTMPEAIEVEPMEEKIIYDPITQKVKMDLRIVGTRSLKTSSTRQARGGFKTDRKNEIDDSKVVK